MRDIHAYDYNGGYYDAEIVSDLLNLKCVTDVTEEKQVVSVSGWLNHHDNRILEHRFRQMA